MERRYIAPRMSSKDYVRKGGAKSVRFTADYWAEIRKRKQEQAEKLMQQQVQAHLRFISEDGKPPVYVFFGSGKEADYWSREFRRRLDVTGYSFDRNRDMIAARPERMRGISRRMVAVWSSDPMPASRYREQQEIDAMYFIEERNHILGYEPKLVGVGGAVSRETPNA
ncbi:hypothetical protein FDH61_gp29 [Arthrobacter phage Preamble]|uniref:Uncharacterized protein n=1 Tax=Arthrobacter phage Preamble TaxID=1772310 RepID=A0A0U4K9A2_9CAUD|nr:hypothetical protein FDH61_gp29 [Arthrobacter phage Preamble]ALY09811.1 hypothetical protein PREAMBLE_29 [Arthrobacter phage Preamble]